MTHMRRRTRFKRGGNPPPKPPRPNPPRNKVPGVVYGNGNLDLYESEDRKMRGKLEDVEAYESATFPPNRPNRSRRSIFSSGVSDAVKYATNLTRRALRRHVRTVPESQPAIKFSTNPLDLEESVNDNAGLTGVPNSETQKSYYDEGWGLPTRQTSLGGRRRRQRTYRKHRRG